MIKKSFVALAALLCGSAAFATPGAYTEWFANAVSNPLPTGWSSGATLVDRVVPVTSDEVVSYTAGAPVSAYAKQTVTVSSEPLDMLPLPTTGESDPLKDARFAFGVAQLDGDTAPVVYVLSKVDGTPTWTKTTASVGNANDGAATAVEVTYDKTAQTFTVAGVDTVFTSLLANSDDWTVTSFVGNGAVNALVGEKSIDLTGEIAIAQGTNPQQVVVSVLVSNAEGQMVTVTATDKNGTALLGTHTGVVTGGQAVITIDGEADTGYTFEVSIGGTSLGEGAFFTGNVWFGAYPHGTTETLVNGTWDAAPTVTDGKYVVNSSSGNKFTVTNEKKGEGNGKRTVMTHVVTFTSAIDPEDLPEVTSGTIGAITVANAGLGGAAGGALGGTGLEWKGVVNGAWKTLEGATPALDTEYTVTVTYDPTEHTFIYAANGEKLGSTTATTGFSGVTAVGAGTIAKIEATVGDPLPAAEGYLTAAENGKPIRVDDAFASALVPAGDHAAIQAALNTTPAEDGLTVWQAYALGATADKAKAGVKPVISGEQTTSTTEMKLVDGYTVRENTGITVTRTVKTKATAAGDWTTDGAATQNADGVTVALPAEGAKAKYIKIEYSFQ